MAAVKTLTNLFVCIFSILSLGTAWNAAAADNGYEAAR